MHLTGRLLDRDGAAVRDALIEIWQADDNGRYHHSRDTRSEPLDENFQGFGQALVLHQAAVGELLADRFS